MTCIRRGMANLELQVQVIHDPVAKAIERLRAFEPPEGYYLAFSGGKDSQCIYHLAQESGVKFEAHYNITTADPPELVAFIKQYYPDVIRDKPSMNLWDLIAKHRMPPTRLVRYCCEVLKERGGEDRLVVTGVRWAESNKRKGRGLLELPEGKSKRIVLMNDNDARRQMTEHCHAKGKSVLNPIIDWSESQVWEYIHSRDLSYCKLYDEGFKRLGCIGCPMGNTKQQLRDFKRWPYHKQLYIKAFDRMVERRIADGLKTTWKDGQDVFNWWLKIPESPMFEP
jgi:phosphoadenosine phosphosulfate reductase